MKYWFIIKGSLPEEVARKLWDRICCYKANLTVLFDRTYVYGDADTPWEVEQIVNAVVDTGYPVERG